MTDTAQTLREYAEAVIQKLRRYAGGLCISTPVELEAADEIERLRAELDVLKTQKPVYYASNNAFKNRATTMLVGMYAVNTTDVPLYAKQVPSVPDDTALLRQALEALEDAHYTIEQLQDIGLRRRTIDALQERLK